MLMMTVQQKNGPGSTAQTRKASERAYQRLHNMPMVGKNGAAQPQSSASYQVVPDQPDTLLPHQHLNYHFTTCHPSKPPHFD